VLVLVAIVLSTLIGFTSLAIDIGYQRVVRRDMQAVADVVALDLSRRLDGRTAQTIMTTPLSSPPSTPAAAGTTSRRSPAAPSPWSSVCSTP